MAAGRTEELGPPSFTKPADVALDTSLVQAQLVGNLLDRVASTAKGDDLPVEILDRVRLRTLRVGPGHPVRRDPDPNQINLRLHSVATPRRPPGLQRTRP